MTKKLKPLSPDLLRKKLNSKQLGFKTTKNLKLFTNFIGQERALSAVQFGITMKKRGYNLFAMGPTGIGKHSLIHQVLKKHAEKQAKPSDWCYIHNFENPEKPIALELPPGKGYIFQQDMKNLIDELSNHIPTAFESREYRRKMKNIEKNFNKKNVIRDTKPSRKKSKEYYHPFKERLEKEIKLKTRLVSMVVKPLFSKLKKKNSQFPEIVKYLNAAQQDIIWHVDDFISHDKETDLFAFFLENPALTRYKINLLVDNRASKGAPVIFEETPTYSNLISRVEYTTQQGTLTTNFSLIRAGALLRANGGYLIIESRKILKNTHAWEALKNALYSKKIKIEPIQNSSGPIKTISLEPMPIPFETKIILMGSRSSYYFLCQHDHDFLKLFKVAADFDEYIVRNKKNIHLYARLLANMIKQENLQNFSVSAIIEIINHSSRIAEDSEKLSTHISAIKDLILESAYWATQENKEMVAKEHVKKAIDTHIHRMDRTRENYYADINRQFIIIKTNGKAIGQVNCLSVRRAGNFSFGHPTRVTANVRLGKGKLIDIQREIKLAGPFHSKAGLVISSFLANLFSQDELFALSASISFEQIYCWTDGDSASVGELCALISALANVPINQFLSVTGSIDQYGTVQAIGGVNEKIEGFYDVCHAKKLTGNQGVIIPAVNVTNLMLREDIVLAAQQKKFFIYPIATMEDAIQLLTGLPAGARDKKGNYPKNSVYYKAKARLHEFLIKLRARSIKI